MNSNNQQWSTNGKYFEYTKAANPQMTSVSAQAMAPDLSDNRTKIIPIDLAHHLETPYPATSPNCLVNFVHIVKGDSLKCEANATSHVFVVIGGSGTVKTVAGAVNWKTGDIFAIPSDSNITLNANDTALLYWINDSPLLNYLQVKPASQSFIPTIYTLDEIKKNAAAANQEKNAALRNRNGVLLANETCTLTKTITPTLWALFNVIHPHTVQAPHKHNSVALDLSVSAKPGVYTLMSEKIDSDGNLINPMRFDWGNGKAFITPPGWWHIHINESDEDAIVVPIQDAGLQTYMRTLFIKFKV